MIDHWAVCDWIDTHFKFFAAAHQFVFLFPFSDSCQAEAISFPSSSFSSNATQSKAAIWTTEGSTALV